MPAQSLSRGERDRALSALHGTRKMLLDIAESVTPAQWNFKPAPEVWSIAEIAEHIALSEDLLAKAAAQALAAPGDPEKLKLAAGKDQTILTQVPVRDQKFKAPESITPKQTFASREALVSAFKASRDRNIAFIRDTGADLRGHSADHPALGPMDAYQWYLLIASHTERHLNQMKEVMANPSYPK